LYLFKFLGHLCAISFSLLLAVRFSENLPPVSFGLFSHLSTLFIDFRGECALFFEPFLGLRDELTRVSTSAIAAIPHFACNCGLNYLDWWLWALLDLLWGFRNVVSAHFIVLFFSIHLGMSAGVHHFLSCFLARFHINVGCIYFSRVILFLLILFGLKCYFSGYCKPLGRFELDTLLLLLFAPQFLLDLLFSKLHGILVVGHWQSICNVQGLRLVVLPLLVLVG
jgi:hypothetical protein